MYDCLLHHFTISKCILKCAQEHFRQPPTSWLKFERGTFRPPGWGLVGCRGQGQAHLIAHPWVPISYTLTHMVYMSVTVFELFNWLKSISDRPTRPSIAPEATILCSALSHILLSVRPGICSLLRTPILNISENAIAKPKHHCHLLVKKIIISSCFTLIKH